MITKHILPPQKLWVSPTLLAYSLVCSLVCPQFWAQGSVAHCYSRRLQRSLKGNAECRYEFAKCWSSKTLYWIDWIKIWLSKSRGNELVQSFWKLYSITYWTKRTNFINDSFWHIWFPKKMFVTAKPARKSPNNKIFAYLKLSGKNLQSVEFATICFTGMVTLMWLHA